MRRMSLLNIDSLLQPVSTDNPTGDNLEYDPDFADLERSAQGKPERQAGATILPAEPPEWPIVQKKATELAARSKDLRIIVLLVRALLERYGMEGLAEGLELTHRTLEQYWEGLHPQLDPDDDNDPGIRVNTLALLCDAAVLNAVRGTPLVRSRTFGMMSLRQFQIAAGLAPAPEGGAVDGATLQGAVTEVGPEAVTAVAASVAKVREHLKGIDAVFDQQAPGRGPDLTPILQVVSQIQSALSPYLEVAGPGEGIGDGAGDGTGETGGESGSSPGAGPARPGRLGEIGSRDDVIKAIDRICAYYAKHEVASPVPLLLNRCKRLVHMSFLDLLREMAPDAVSHVETIIGPQDQ